MKNKIGKLSMQQACIQKQQELISSFKQRETELYNDVYKKDATLSQSENRTAGKVDLLNAMGNELAFAQQELEYLNSLDVKKESTLVEPGAVVVTNQMTFFIGISSEQVEIDGETFFGLSTKAPIYASMKGLQKGDKFEFNKTQYVVEEVY